VKSCAKIIVVEITDQTEMEDILVHMLGMFMTALFMQTAIKYTIL
jgi:hypothetical protein